MKKLISMMDYVLEIENYLDLTNRQKLEHIINYANFLKKPLNLGMFVPCDENGNVLEYIKNPYEDFCDKENVCRLLSKEEIKYQQAKERVLFDGFEICDRLESVKCVVNGYFHFSYEDAINKEKTVEDLIRYDLTLKKE